MPHLPLHVKRTTPHRQLRGRHITAALVVIHPLIIDARPLAQLYEKAGKPLPCQRIAFMGQEYSILSM